MKLRTTKKAIKESRKLIISINYCDLQYLLAYKKAFAYSAGVDGWHCDYYEFDNIIISTGYSTIGQKVNYDKIRDTEKRAEEIYLNNGHDEGKILMKALLKEFLDYVESEAKKC